MIDPSTSIAVVIAAMLVLVLLRALGLGEITPPRCPICGSGSASKHDEDCPWRSRQEDRR